MKVIPVLIGAIILGLAILGSIGISGEGEVSANVPACVPPLACDAGVTHDTLDIPGIAAILEVKAEVSWSQSSAWIGVIDEKIPSSCESLPSHLNCDTDELSFVAGGPESSGTFSWSAEPGSYRFASGSDTTSSSLSTNSVSYSWSAGLSTGLMFTLFGLGIGLLAWGIKPSPQ